MDESRRRLHLDYLAGGQVGNGRGSPALEIVCYGWCQPATNAYINGVGLRHYVHVNSVVTLHLQTVLPYFFIATSLGLQHLQSLYQCMCHESVRVHVHLL